MTTTSVYDLVRQAILTRSSISAVYKGHQREMTPHVLGRKFGRPHALLYQYAGTSSSRTIGPAGATYNWRCLFIDELSSVTIVPGVVHTGPNHTQQQSCVEEIDVVVQY